MQEEPAATTTTAVRAKQYPWTASNKVTTMRKLREEIGKELREREKKNMRKGISDKELGKGEANEQDQRKQTGHRISNGVKRWGV